MARNNPSTPVARPDPADLCASFTKVCAHRTLSYNFSDATLPPYKVGSFVPARYAESERAIFPVRSPHWADHRPAMGKLDVTLGKVRSAPTRPPGDANRAPFPNSY